MTTYAIWIRPMLRAAVLLVAIGVAGCTTKKTEAPALSGPSEFGQSISVTATPDRISQDGVSQVRVEATIRDSQGKPTQGVTVQWTVDASTGTLVEPSLQQTVTDGQGRAVILVTAPAPPAVLPDTPARLTITAKAVLTDVASTLNTKSVVVQLVPVPGTLPPNRLPDAAFSIVPAIGNIMQHITFDASATKDEGEPCGDLCTYQWDFGDFQTASGRVVTHEFTNPKASPGYTVTLTVVDTRGGVDSITRGIIINGPAAPVASFTATPATVSATTGNRVVAFDAAASTIGLGGTIVEYHWNWGHDGAEEVTTGPTASHQFPATEQSYTVVLTIEDNFGRTAFATRTITVGP